MVRVDLRQWPVGVSVDGDWPAIAFRLEDRRYEIPGTSPQSIRLTAEQRGLARAIAELRNSPKVDAGVQSKKLLRDRGEFETHLMGVEAELAFSSLVGGEMDLSLSMSGDSGHDVRVGPYRVEVKCRRQRGYSFALMGLGSMRSDAGALVYQCGDEYVVHGVISREKFRRVAVRRDYGYGPRLVAEPSEFTDWSALRYRPGDWMGLPEQVASGLMRQGWTLESRDWTFRRASGEPQFVDVVGT